MRRRIFNRTTLTGLGSLLVALLPYFEAEQMSITTIVLALIGSALVIWGFIEKPQQRLKRSELNPLIEQRETYLVPLKSTIQEILTITDRLAIEAGEYPLEEYKKRYLPFHKNPLPISIQNALVSDKFMWDNHYYQLLKDKDKGLQPLMTEYNGCYSQVVDGKLRKYLKQLWRIEHWTGSFKAYCILAKGNRNIPHTATGLNIAGVGESINEDNINNVLSKVNTRIIELLDGAEDE